MKLKHQAPHINDFDYDLDVTDRKAIKQYNNTRMRKLKDLKKLKKKDFESDYESD